MYNVSRTCKGVRRTDYTHGESASHCLLEFDAVKIDVDVCTSLSYARAFGEGCATRGQGSLPAAPERRHCSAAAPRTPRGAPLP